MSSFPQNRNIIRYHKNSNKPMNPKEREEINLEGNWTKTMAGDNFILVNHKKGKDNQLYIKKLILILLTTEDKIVIFAPINFST